MKSNILSRNFGILSLLKFASPTIMMLIFMSLYTIVDGIFVSRFVGTAALSAVNIIFPIYSVFGAFSLMLATGGSAVIAHKMGAGRGEEAKQNFTFFAIFGFVLGVIFCILGIIFIKPIIRFLGATDAIFDMCYDYAMILFFLAPVILLQQLFQFNFVTSGKPAIGLLVTVAGGVLNMIMDYVLIVPAKLGIQGAAIATGMGMLLPTLIGLAYFTFARKGTLHFVKPSWDFKALSKACLNGSSEAVTQLANAVSTFLFNFLMLKHVGEDGVAAITIVMYSQFLISSLFLGYASGIAPVVSYKHGCKDTSQLKKIFRISIVFISVASVVLFGLTFALNKPLVLLFAKNSASVISLATRGFMLFSVSFLFMGLNIYGSSLFTALSDGVVSASISFMRTFVFLIGCLLLLPLALKVDGIWLAVPIAEACTVIGTILFIVLKGKKYKYLGSDKAATNKKLSDDIISEID